MFDLLTGKKGKILLEYPFIREFIRTRDEHELRKVLGDPKKRHSFYYELLNPGKVGLNWGFKFTKKEIEEFIIQVKTSSGTKAHLETTVGEILESIEGSTKKDLLHGDPKRKIITITSDSRQLGEKSLFIPIVGEKFDGHNFILSLAHARSIEAFLTTRRADGEIAKRYGCAAIYCKDTLKALGDIARYHREKFKGKIQVVGITGTNGKTTTKELIYAILSTKGDCLKSEKNYNNQIGVPFGLMALRPYHDFAVIEMGISHTGDLTHLSGIVRPTIAIITNIGEGHLEFLHTVENVAKAKAEIMNGMDQGSIILLNRDTDYFDSLVEHARKCGLHIWTFGLDSKANAYPDHYSLFPDKIELTYKQFTYTAPLYGIHNLYNMMAAIACGELFRIPPKDIQKGLAKFRNVGSRSQLITKGYIVIDDTYNSNPRSLRYALESAKEIYSKKRRIAILSDMLELGTSSPNYHEQAGEQVVKNGFQLLYTWGKMARLITEGAIKAGMPPQNAKHFDSKEQLMQEAKANIRKGDLILVKGSRSMKMEEVVAHLK